MHLRVVVIAEIILHAFVHAHVCVCVHNFKMKGSDIPGAASTLD